MAQDHHQDRFNRAFALGVGLNLAFVVVELSAGFLANSLALITDAGHNLTDVAGLLLAWVARVMATRPPTVRRTYGYRRLTILASLASAVALALVMGGIAWEAVRRLAEPAPVASGTIILVAAIGTVINAFTALLFMAGRRGDLNIRGAFLHMAADALVSLGVVAAGLVIHFTGRLWIDPVISLAVVAVILAGTWGLLRDSFNLALDAVPRNIDPMRVRAFLEALPGVREVHDLHIWAMSTTEVALTAHLVMPGPRPTDDFLDGTARRLREEQGIHHVTLQVEERRRGRECPQSPESSL